MGATCSDTCNRPAPQCTATTAEIAWRLSQTAKAERCCVRLPPPASCGYVLGFSQSVKRIALLGSAASRSSFSM